MGGGEKGFGVIGPYASLEPQLAYVALLVQTCNLFVRSLQHVSPGDHHVGSIQGMALHLANRLRSRVPPTTWSATGQRQRQRQQQYWEEYGVHAAAHLVLAGVPNATESAAIANHAFRDLSSICSWSPFNTWSILQGVSRTTGGAAYARAASEYCWRNMVEHGRGCFWELDSPMWGEFMQDGDKAPFNPSLCHPWSSGVTAFLSSDVLGLRPVLPGHGVWVAVPHVGADLPAVKGRVPTAAAGIVHVAANWSATATSVEVSAASAGFVGVKRRGSPAGVLLAVTVDGRAIAIHSEAGVPTQLRQGTLSTAQLAEHVFTPLLAAGAHTIVAVYAQPSAPRPAADSRGQLARLKLPH